MTFNFLEGSSGLCSLWRNQKPQKDAFSSFSGKKSVNMTGSFSIPSRFMQAKILFIISAITFRRWSDFKKLQSFLSLETSEVGRRYGHYCHILEIFVQIELAASMKI